MKVELFSFLRQKTGVSEVYMFAGDVRTLLQRLAAFYGEEFSKLLMTREGTLEAGVNILVNGRNILFLNGLETELQEEDTVTLIPPAAGG